MAVISLMIMAVAFDLSTAVEDKIRMESLGMTGERIEASAYMIDQVEDGWVELDMGGGEYTLEGTASNPRLRYEGQSVLLTVQGGTQESRSIDLPSGVQTLATGSANEICILKKPDIGFVVAAQDCLRYLGG